jgi:hypothetical protein
MDAAEEVFDVEGGDARDRFLALGQAHYNPEQPRFLFYPARIDLRKLSLPSEATTS